MKMKEKIREEKGMALVVVLGVVVLLSLIGTTILFSSNAGRNISTSYRASAEALQNADAGIAEAARKLYNKEIVGDGTVGWNYNGYSANIANEYMVSYVLREDGSGAKTIALDEYGSPIYQIMSKGYVATTFTNGQLNKTYVATSARNAGVEKKLLAMVQVISTPGTPVTPGTDPVTTTTTEIDPAFGMGIITDGDLRINGASNINGSTHTNGNTRINGSGTVPGTISSHGSITTNGTWNIGAEVPNAPTITVPEVTANKIAELKALAQAQGTYHNGNYNYNGSGDLSNQIIFAEGNLTLNGSIKNGTIVATGHVTINGSSQINTSGTIGTAIIALGNITMNGANDSYGAFWNNGSFVQNGTSRVIGSIVSLGDITRNGAFNFTANKNIDNNNLPRVTTTTTIPGTPGTPGTPALSKFKILSRQEL